MKILAKVFGNAAGLGSQPLRWRRSTTQTDREVSIGLCRRRDRETTAQHPYLNDWKGTERERERHHRPTSLTLAIEGERSLTLTIEGDRERETTTQPPSHLHLNDTRR